MPWESSNNSHLPPDWKHRRARVIARAGRNCEVPNCLYEGTEVDHIVNVKSGGSHELDNLQLLCKWHHKEKTQLEATLNRPRKPSIYRDKPKHPGLT